MLSCSAGTGGRKFCHEALAAPLHDEPSPSSTLAPADSNKLAVEQVAAWFQNRDKLGLVRIWPHLGTYQQFSQLDFLPEVRATLKKIRAV